MRTVTSRIVVVWRGDGGWGGRGGSRRRGLLEIELLEVGWEVLVEPYIYNVDEPPFAASFLPSPLFRPSLLSYSHSFGARAACLLFTTLASVTCDSPSPQPAPQSCSLSSKMAEPAVAEAQSSEEGASEPPVVKAQSSEELDSEELETVSANQTLTLGANRGSS